MEKIIFLYLLFLTFINSNISDNSFNIIKLQDFTKINFNLNNEFLVFEYYNNIYKLFNSSIYFIFDIGQRASTKV